MENKTDYLLEGTFPLFITSQDKKLTFQTFIKNLAQEKKELSKLLLTHGAIVFRGFPVKKAADFATVVETLGLGEFVNYVGGDSPRDKVEEKVYTSTEAPPRIHIALHQELSYIKNFPANIYFFCETPAQTGGETIIGDARRIYKVLDEEIKNRFQQNHLTYISRYYYQNKIMDWVNRWQRSHKSWIEVFETNDKKEVEKKCRENEFEWRWLANDWIEIKQTRPAIISHPLTKETVWFNQAHLYDFNPHLLGWMNYIAAKLFYFRKSTLLHEIRFADGSKIPRQDLYHIIDVLKENTVAFPWQKGDVMVLDNILAMHGRSPFTGRRRVLTALTKKPGLKIRSDKLDVRTQSKETEHSF